MQIIGINEENIEIFDGMLSDIEKMELLLGNDIFALGVIEDNKACGEIVVRIRGQALIIESIYVDPEFRRRGFATDLVLNAADYASNLDTFFGFRVSFVEDEEFGEDLYKFFNYLEFSFEKSEEAMTYKVQLCDIDMNKLGRLSEKIINRVEVKSYKDISKYEQGLLNKEPVMLYPGIINGEVIEEDLSYFIFGKKEADAAIIVSENEGDLTIEWTRVNLLHSSYLILIFKMMILKAIEKYGADTMIYIPVVNKQSDKLVNSLFGNKKKVVENMWEATFEFDYDIIEE